MPHTRQKQVLEVQSQSLPSSKLHPHHPHTTHVTPQSLTHSHSLTHSLTIPIHRNATTNTHINNNHTITLTTKSERGKLRPTPGRCKCLQSRVSNFLLQPCINTTQTQLTSHHNLSLALSLTYSQYQSIGTPLLTHTFTTITQYLSPHRVREVSCAPHPADASACSPESVTPSSKTASTPSTHNTHHTKTTLSDSHNVDPPLALPTHQQKSHSITHFLE